MPQIEIGIEPTGSRQHRLYVNDKHYGEFMMLSVAAREAQLIVGVLMDLKESGILPSDVDIVWIRDTPPPVTGVVDD